MLDVDLALIGWHSTYISYKNTARAVHSVMKLKSEGCNLLLIRNVVVLTHHVMIKDICEHLFTITDICESFLSHEMQIL